jgi:hypothetical protein
MRIGFHTAVGGLNNGITQDYFLPLDNAGVPIVLKAVNDWGIAKEVLTLKEYSGVPHFVMFRVSDKNHPEWDLPSYGLPPDTAFNVHWMKLYQVLPTEYLDSNWYKENIVLNIINEPDKNRADWLGWFCLEAAQFAVANNFRFSLPSFAAGEPEIEHWETPGMLTFLDYASSHSHNVLVDLHEYSYDNDDIWSPRDPDGKPGFYHVGRFQALHDVCDAHGISHPRITIGEFGWNSTTAPHIPLSMEHVIEANALYSQFSNISGVVLWCLGPWQGDIAQRIHDLIAPVADYALMLGGPMPQPDEPSRIKHVIHITPQDTTQEQMDALTRHLAPTKTGFTHSHDMVEAVMYHSTPDGEIHAWDEWRWPMNLREQFAWLGVQYVPREFSEIVDGGPVPPQFRFEAWPTEHEVVTQVFGNNPEYYSRFGLPGHEGVDIKAPLGSLLFAVAPGEVFDVVAYDDGHNYGIRVRVRHSHGYSLTYAHMQSVQVSVGDKVTAGQILGRADNTGNIISGVSHSHITLKNDEAWEGGPMYIGYPYNIVDPTPFLVPFNPAWPSTPPLPPPPTGDEIDLVPYLLPSNLGPGENGVLYEVQTFNGPQQRHQTQADFGAFYHTKDNEWEELTYNEQYIYRSIDTSPGEEGGIRRYYELQDDLDRKWSHWCLRRMAIGTTYYRNPIVSFHNKDNCALLTQDHQQSLIKLLSVVGTMTFFTGITLSDVIILQWQEVSGNPLEDYYYAKGYGLVGWNSHIDGRKSAISEIHAPGARPDNLREVIDCL